MFSWNAIPAMVGRDPPLGKVSGMTYQIVMFPSEHDVLPMQTIRELVHSLGGVMFLYEIPDNREHKLR